MKRYCGFIFDLDGTLADTSAGIMRSVVHTLNTLQIPLPSQKILRTFIGPPIYESFQIHCGMSPVSALKATDIFREHYGNEHLFDAEVYSEIPDLLDFLHNHKLQAMVATNKRTDHATALLQYLELAKYFKIICGSDAACRLKKADVIRNAYHASATAPERCVMIGDTKSDADGALANNIDFIGVTYGFGFSPSGVYPDFTVCHSPKELLSKIKAVL